MHHALDIQEILLNIFGHYYSRRTRKAPSGLAALARTCRAFKEPALDVLWEELYNLSPLVRCLPEASYRLPSEKLYSFSRLPTGTEWDILRSYTCRIRSIQDMKSRINRESLEVLVNFTTTDTVPLFPNLRYLRCKFLTEGIPLSHLPLPSLISLDLRFMETCIFRNYFESFPNFSPRIKELFIDVDQLGPTLHKIDPNYFCQWKNLQIVHCYQVTLDNAILVHLSRMPALTELTFKLSATLTAFDSPLFFSGLHHLTLQSGYLAPISGFLSQTRMSVIELSAFVDETPSTQDVSCFFASVQTSNTACTIQTLWLVQSSLRLTGRNSDALLSLNDLWPCTAFNNLCSLNVDIAWDVNLMDGDLLTLALAWPYLECLLINVNWGWNVLGGITPKGLLRLLQTCRSLERLALVIDTQGYNELPQSPENFGLALSSDFSINVLDSVLQAEAVPAIAAFLAGVVPHPSFDFDCWNCMSAMDNPPGWTVHRERWEDACRLAGNFVGQRS